MRPKAFFDPVIEQELRAINQRREERMLERVTAHMILGAAHHKHHYVGSLDYQPNDEYRAILERLRSQSIVTGSSPARLTFEGQQLAAGIVCAHALATSTDEVA